MKANPVITITPPIRGTKEDPNPQWVELGMKVEVYHGVDEDYGALSEADRVQYNFWYVVHTLGDRLHGMPEEKEVEHWPEDILVLAAMALLTANTALKQWLREDYLECLVTCEMAQRQVKEFLKLRHPGRWATLVHFTLKG